LWRRKKKINFYSLPVDFWGERENNKHKIWS
jgi:hypothetical protein